MADGGAFPQWPGLWLLLSWLCVSSVFAAERQVIEAFDYPDDAAAQAAWTPVNGSQPVAVMEEPIDGRKGLRLPCEKTGERPRAIWDHALSLDLSRADHFSFWLYVDELSKGSVSYSFHFQSGEGWYSAFFYTTKGWHQITLDKSKFETEGAPSGWNHITGMRVSAWKPKGVISFMAMDDLEAISSRVVVVLGNRTAQDDREWNTVRAQALMMGELLARIGVEAGTLNDTDVEAGALEGAERKVAIFPYNPNMSDKEAEAAEKFIDAGGKVIGFFNIPQRLLGALGLEATGSSLKMPEYHYQFASLHFKPAGIEGMPLSMKQHSWCINPVKASGKNARIIGEWFNAQDEATGLPALAISDTGAYMTHILLGEDVPAKDQMMMALLGNLMPEAWTEAVRRTLAESETVGEFKTLKDAEVFMKKSGNPAAMKHLAVARSGLVEAQAIFGRKQYVQAIAMAKRAQQELNLAYCSAQSSRAPEIRAVWCHSAFGVPGMTWDAAIKTLADNGMNAVFPNMLSGGRAYCKSKALPMDDSVATKGDQLAECIAAGKKYGVQVHAWKVNWNLADCSKEFLEKMRAEKRTQKDPQGKDINWLCPSNPLNFEMERDSMLDVVRNYDVDGIHFDYIRYPDAKGCYCDGCRECFEREYNVKVKKWPADVLEGDLKSKYLDFRRSNITRLVKAVSEEAHRLKPKIKVSAAVFIDCSEWRDSIGQDWCEWVEKGYLDMVCPMNYTEQADQFEGWVMKQLAVIRHAVLFCPGIGVIQGERALTACQTVDQINAARRQESDGFILFNYDSTVANNILPGLHAGVTAEKCAVEKTK